MARCSQCRRVISSPYTMCYSCQMKRRDSSLATFGRKKCKKCGTIISRDRPYCWPCYKKLNPSR